MSVDLKKLRQQLQQQRKSVSGFEHQRTQQQVFQRLIRLKKFQQAHKVGIYLHAFVRCIRGKSLNIVLNNISRFICR